MLKEGARRRPRTPFSLNHDRQAFGSAQERKMSLVGPVEAPIC